MKSSKLQSGAVPNKIVEAACSCYTNHMDFTRKLPVGIQSFEKLRRNGYIYIDKTPFIWRLIQSSNP